MNEVVAKVVQEMYQEKDKLDVVGMALVARWSAMLEGTLGGAVLPETGLKQRPIKRKKEEYKEEEGTVLVPITGGELDGNFVPLSSAMPVGAHVEFAGQVYTLTPERTLVVG